MNKIFVLVFLFISFSTSSQIREIKIISRQPEWQESLNQISADKYPLVITINKRDSIWLRGHQTFPHPDNKYFIVKIREDDSVSFSIKAINIAKSRRRNNKNWQSCNYYDTSLVLHPKDFKEGYVHIISPYDKKEKEKTFTITSATRKVIKRLRRSKPQAIYDAVTGTVIYIRELAKKAPGVY